MSTVATSAGLAADLGALKVGPELLAAGDPAGPLAGIEIVVKDLIDVAGVATSAGNPRYLETHTVPTAHAPAVARMLAVGATVVGKSHTDELAFSLSGTNVHYGTPVNPRCPERVPGGSSSGSASAVAGGLVPLALSTDTGGSIRVPSSYCGIAGIRPSHGRVPLEGVVEFAPFFGTVGVMAGNGALLEAGALALLEATPSPDLPTHLVVADDLIAQADPAVGAAVVEAAGRIATSLELKLSHGDLTQGRLSTWFETFRNRQMVEAWVSHGEWITEAAPDLGPGITARFAMASSTPSNAGEAATAGRALVQDEIDAFLPPGGVLVLPSAATVAPLLDLEGPVKDDLRMRTMHLTCVAGLGGLPAVSMPVAEVDGLPVGLCLVGRPGDDELLLALAASINPEDYR